MSKDLVRGFLLAHNAPKEIMEALNIITDCKENDYSLDTPMYKYELSVRTANCLSLADIQTIGELISLSESEILKIPNFGRKSLNELRDVINPLRFSCPAKVTLIFDGRHSWVYPRKS